MPRLALIVECIAIFIALPLVYRFSPWRVPALPLLWVVTAYALWQLSRGSGFNSAALWNASTLAPNLPAMLLLFVPVAAVLWLAVHLWEPRLEWGFVRQHPFFWGIVMVLYPILSVYPQGILYRAFFLQRYATLVPDAVAGRWTIIFASAAAFSFLHIIFRNWISVVLTFFGGILFAWRYQETGSLLTSSAEHALYGCWLFTVGLGEYFYHGVWPRPK